MKIAIIGGGITGLTAAYTLSKNGHQVTVFEKETFLGGLAGGLKKNHWQWPMERSYHHFFTNDKAFISLVKELGSEKNIIIKRPITATLVNALQRSKKSKEKHDSDNPHVITKLDSPVDLLTFPLLSPVDKLRTAGMLCFCKINPWWKPLEQITAHKLFRSIGGTTSWNLLWQPLMEGKFGNYSDRVAASWLWARIYKRTPHLGYLKGGFQTLIDGLERNIKKNKGTFFTGYQVTHIVPKNNTVSVSFFPAKKKTAKRQMLFDKILLTTPSSISSKLVRFPSVYTKNLCSIPHLFAQTLVVETDTPILNSVYWLNINDRMFPFLALVQHTNFMDKKYYGKKHIAYIGNYLSEGHPFLSMTKEQLFKTFLPYIKKINPSFIYDRKTVKYDLFTAPFAQPVHTKNYSKKAPDLETPIPNIYLANLDSIYPWDRGTNYAIELGQKAAHEIIRQDTV